jgi:hypothetical protein
MAFLELKFSDGRDVQTEVPDGSVKIEIPWTAGPKTRFLCIDGLVFAQISATSGGKPPWVPTEV